MSYKYFLLLGSFILGTAPTVGCSPEFRTCEVRHVCKAGGASGVGGTFGVTGGAAARGGTKSGGAGNQTDFAGEGGAVGDGGEVGSDTDDNGGSGGAPNVGGGGGAPEAGGIAGVGGAVGGSGAPNFLQDGALCTTSSECSSKNCGGRCCAVGKPCSCPQPSAKNLLKNPGFDSNVSGWTVTGNGTFHWVSVRGDDQDATSCPYSGFGRFYSNGVLTVSQCVAVSSANSYNLSTAVSNGSFGDFPNAGFGHMDCSLDWFTGPECTGSMPVVADGALKSQWLNGSWSPTDVLGDGPWFPPSGVVSARLSCTDTCDGDEPCYANIDKMGIVEAPATY